MPMPKTARFKEILGDIPFSAEIYWRVRNRGRAIDPNFNLSWLEEHLPTWAAQAGEARRQAQAGKRLALFATLPYWIEHTCLVGLALAGLGHQVSLGFLPYAYYKKPGNLFDLRRQNAYAWRVLQPAGELIHITALLETRQPPHPLPAALTEEIANISGRDYQFSRQVETVDPESRFYRLRQARNSHAAQGALAWLSAEKPDGVIVPGGNQFEFAAVTAAACHLDLPVRTYDFGQQPNRIWLAKKNGMSGMNPEAARNAAGPGELSAAQRTQVLEAIHGGNDKPGAIEGQSLRTHLGLDDRPTVLLEAEGIGEVQTLGKEIFSENQADWLARTLQHFAGRPDVQLLIRTPLTDLISSRATFEQVLIAALPEIPPHFTILTADAPIRIQELAGIAGLGLAYTTLAGLEMAMAGLPVITAGQSHYREKGFTLDPQDWDSFYSLIHDVLSDPDHHRPSSKAVDLAWRYAHQFLTTHTRPFPWHLATMRESLARWPLSRLLSPEGETLYHPAFQVLAGERDRPEGG